MSNNINNTSRSSERRDESQGPGASHMKPRWIVTVAVYLVLITTLVFYGLIKLWPYPTPSGERPTDQTANSQTPANQSNAGNSQAQPGNAGGSTNTGGSTNAGGATNPPASGNSQTPPANTSGGSTTPPSGSGGSQTPPNNAAGSTIGQSAQNQNQTQTGNAGTGGTNNQKPAKPLPDPDHIKFFGGRFEADVYLETRLLLLVMLAGALGSLMHALRSLYWYTGNRKMVWSWVALYVLLPVTGAMLATVFYFVVRGGFFSSQASFETTSPFGFVALSALVGLFSPQATLKLKEIAETVFSKPGPGADNKPQESTTPTTKPAPTIASVTPASGSATAPVVIAGTNFSDGVVVKLGGIAGSVSSVSETSITVVVPANTAATGPVDVQVTNADGQTVTLPQAFTYVAGSATDAAAVDELDGHEEIKSNTTDEELPITEGGVE